METHLPVPSIDCTNGVQIGEYVSPVSGNFYTAIVLSAVEVDAEGKLANHVCLLRPVKALRCAWLIVRVAMKGLLWRI